MLSKRSFERHVTKAIKKCQIEDNEGNANKSASADADERNLLSTFQKSGIPNFNESDCNTVGEQENFD